MSQQQINQLQPVLINGEWRNAKATSSFQAFNPTTGELLPVMFPVSKWEDCDDALNAAELAYRELQQMSDAVRRESLAKFLSLYASAIESNSSALVEMAHLETGLAKSPRLADVEIPRTCSQLNQASDAVKLSSWSQPTIDSQMNIRSMLQGIGPVAVFGPNNFPFAFGSISGGDFAAAIAAGNPVIAKAHPAHPATTQLFAQLALEAAKQAGLPKAMVQLIFAMDNSSGLDLVSDPRIAASAFTGSRAAGLALKAAADKAGKLIYLELSSINPVVILAGAIEQSAEKIAEEFANSCTMAAGQLCTKPGLLIVPDDKAADDFVEVIAQKFSQGVVGTLLSAGAAENLLNISSDLVAAGAELLTRHSSEESSRFCQPNTLLSVSAESFISNSEIFQSEMFGNASLIIRANNSQQIAELVGLLEGNLTGFIYSATNGSDDADYQIIENQLRQKVGRIINDKMPTGVAVSAAMNHGGPFPASGHPGFTAVGLPSSIKRFAALKCFDGVRAARLPDLLQDQNISSLTWRLIDGQWTTAAVASKS